MSEAKTDASDELRGLLRTLCEGELDPVGYERIEQLVRGRPEAIDLFLNYCWLHGELRWQTLPSAADAHPAAARDTAATRPNSSVLGFLSTLLPDTLVGRSNLFWAVAIAVNAIAVFLMALALSPKLRGGPDGVVDVATAPRQNRGQPEKSTEARAIAARLSNSMDCVWRGANAPRLGDSQPSDRFALVSGVAEFTFANGVQITVEGPSEFALLGPMETGLFSGRLTALVPPQGVGFAVQTPTARIVDLGTEFGVQVAASGESAVQVYQGRVDLTVTEAGRPAASGGPSAPIRIPAGESRRVERSKQGTWVVNNSTLPESITRPPSPLSDSRRFSNRDDRLQARKQLFSDPALLVHYQFEGPGQAPGRLINHAPATMGRYDGEIHGATWDTGRRVGWAALAFDKPDDYVSLSLPGEFKAVSLMASVFIERTDRRLSYIPLVMTDLWNHPGQIHWQFAGGGTTPNCSLCRTATGDVAGANCQVAMKADDFGRWLTAGLVCDVEQAHADFYLDGQVLGSVTFAGPDKIVFGPTRVGNWLPIPQEKQRSLRGRMDELIVFGKALTPIEMAALMDNHRKSRASERQKQDGQ